jgi:prevent-host-death family protein
MDETVGSFDAKTHFSELLDRAEQGEEITITRRGKPVARVVPFATAKPKHDVEAARETYRRLRELAKTTGIKRFDWKEWKKYVEEGRR